MKLIEARKIIETLPETERLAQLAEEAAELAQAALKLRRAIDGTNPTPKTIAEARENLIEEYGDIWCSSMTIITNEEFSTCINIAEQKEIRWGERLKFSTIHNSEKSGR